MTKRKPDRPNRHTRRLQQQQAERALRKYKDRLPPIMFPSEEDSEGLTPIQSFLLIIAVASCVTPCFFPNNKEKSQEKDNAMSKMATGDGDALIAQEHTPFQFFKQKIIQYQGSTLPTKFENTFSKETQQKNLNTSRGTHIKGQKYFLEGMNHSLSKKYNYLLAEAIGIRALAQGESKERKDFQSAQTLLIHAINGVYCSEMPIEKVSRDMLTEKVGKQGIAQLAVASTFFGHKLYDNLDKWGYDSQGLLFKDLDGIRPVTLESLSSNYFIFSISFFELSIDNVKTMKNIYKEMIRKGPPKLHPSVNLSPETYNETLSIFIEACTNTIDQLMQDPYSILDPHSLNIGPRIDECDNLLITCRDQCYPENLENYQQDLDYTDDDCVNIHDPDYASKRITFALEKNIRQLIPFQSPALSSIIFN